jgi:predicted ATPase/class 3 adenylate cyclase
MLLRQRAGRGTPRDPRPGANDDADATDAGGRLWRAHTSSMRTDLPRGVVTLVFTDIEGSTRLLQELGPEQYAGALATHRRIIREASKMHGGVEVDTQGDAFFIAFDSAPGAIAAARRMTHALVDGPVHVRVGIHTGRPTLTDEGYVGEDVHLGARVGAAAHGGQVVLTLATRVWISDDPDVQELGEHRLKDMGRPVRLFQLGDRSFPPLRTISNTNLPHPASSFIGRAEDVEIVLERLRVHSRLITLTGPGGTGKTRLALEVAARALAAFPAGVFWVALATLRDPALVLTAIAEAIGGKGALADHIGERRMLLVLDNLEQVVRVAPDLAALVTGCPGLHIIATSRELLRVQGEVEVRVPPLPAAEAVDLFVERSGLRADRSVVELCARLDNLPLAVELAAARSRALSPAQILDRLAGRLDLLKGGRDADPRQMTLRATIEWSHDLLSAEDQALFRRLAVFAGGSTLEGSEAVADAEIDGLQSLVEKSLLRFADGRYRMLETIQAYASERLAASGDAAEVRGRHGRWIAALLQEADQLLEQAEQGAWLERLSDERDDIRAALQWAISHEDGELAVTIAGCAATFWWIKGDWAEGRQWLSAALALPGPDDSRRARALERAANLDVRLGNPDAAAPLAEESLGISRRLGLPRETGRALRVLALIAWERGDLALTRSLLDDSAQTARAAGDHWALSMALNNLGYLALGDDEPSVAAARFLEAVSLAQTYGDLRSEAFFLENLALAELARNAPRAAADGLASSLSIANQLGFLEVVAADLLGAAAIAMGQDRPEAAAVLLGAAGELVHRTGGGFDEVESRLEVATAEEALRRLGAADLESGVGRGRSEDPDEAVALALEVLASAGTAANARGSA